MSSPSSSKPGLSPPPYRDAATFLKPRLSFSDLDDEGPGGLGCQPSEEFWLRDGSIVIVCGAVGFRVHRSVLSMHSLTFREMLSDSRDDQLVSRREKDQLPTAPREVFDSCPVFRLQDAASDMRYFLKALYDREFLQDKRAHSLFVLGSVLQMTTKYQVPPLRLEIARYVATLFPCTRTGFRALLRDASIAPPDFHPLLGIEIARQCSLPQLLPAACLGAARLTLDAVFDGFRLADGRWMRPVPEVVRACVSFREALRELVENCVHSENMEHGWKQEGGVAAHEGCAGIDRALIRRLEARYRRLECDLVCGSLLESAAPSLAPLTRLCDGCKEIVRAWEEEVQARVWAELPAACGIAGGWEKLRTSLVE